jgi:hypothetical protein
MFSDLVLNLDEVEADTMEESGEMAAGSENMFGDHDMTMDDLSCPSVVAEAEDWTPFY